MKRKAPGNEDVARYISDYRGGSGPAGQRHCGRARFRPARRSKWQAVDLGQVIRQTMDIVSAGLHRAEVALSVEIEENLPHLRGDPAQLKQVFSQYLPECNQGDAEGGALG
jgi:hypothetical protein